MTRINSAISPTCLTDEQREAIIADIRNKLTPIKNLLALLYCDQKNGAITLSPYVKKEMKKSKESIDYLTTLK